MSNPPNSTDGKKKGLEERIYNYCKKYITEKNQCDKFIEKLESERHLINRIQSYLEPYDNGPYPIKGRTETPNYKEKLTTCNIPDQALLSLTGLSLKTVPTLKSCVSESVEAKAELTTELLVSEDLAVATEEEPGKFFINLDIRIGQNENSANVVETKKISIPVRIDQEIALVDRLKASAVGCLINRPLKDLLNVPKENSGKNSCQLIAEDLFNTTTQNTDNLSKQISTDAQSELARLECNKVICISQSVDASKACKTVDTSTSRTIHFHEMSTITESESIIQKRTSWHCDSNRNNTRQAVGKTCIDDKKISKISKMPRSPDAKSKLKNEQHNSIVGDSAYTTSNKQNIHYSANEKLMTKKSNIKEKLPTGNKIMDNKTASICRHSVSTVLNGIIDRLCGNLNLASTKDTEKSTRKLLRNEEPKPSAPTNKYKMDVVEIHPPISSWGSSESWMNKPPTSSNVMFCASSESPTTDATECNTTSVEKTTYLESSTVSEKNHSISELLDSNSGRNVLNRNEEKKQIKNQNNNKKFGNKDPIKKEKPTSAKRKFRAKVNKTSSKENLLQRSDSPEKNNEMRGNNCLDIKPNITEVLRQEIVRQEIVKAELEALQDKIERSREELFSNNNDAYQQELQTKLWNEFLESGAKRLNNKSKTFTKQRNKNRENDESSSENVTPAKLSDDILNKPGPSGIQQQQDDTFFDDYEKLANELLRDDASPTNASNEKLKVFVDVQSSETQRFLKNLFSSDMSVRPKPPYTIKSGNSSPKKKQKSKDLSPTESSYLVELHKRLTKLLGESENICRPNGFSNRNSTNNNYNNLSSPHRDKFRIPSLSTKHKHTKSSIKSMTTGTSLSGKKFKRFKITTEDSNLKEHKKNRKTKQPPIKPPEVLLPDKSSLKSIMKTPSIPQNQPAYPPGYYYLENYPPEYSLNYSPDYSQDYLQVQNNIPTNYNPHLLNQRVSSACLISAEEQKRALFLSLLSYLQKIEPFPDSYDESDMKNNFQQFPLFTGPNNFGVFAHNFQHR